ncbi:hypothetical protein METHPM2_110021 [Pseudomonas sp. PM2]
MTRFWNMSSLRGGWDKRPNTELPVRLTPTICIGSDTGREAHSYTRVNLHQYERFCIVPIPDQYTSKLNEINTHPSSCS